MNDDPTTPHPLDRMLTGDWRWLYDAPRDLWVLLREDGLWLEVSDAGLWGPSVDDWRVIAAAINATTTPGRSWMWVTEAYECDRKRVVSARVVRV